MTVRYETSNRIRQHVTTQRSNIIQEKSRSAYKFPQQHGLLHFPVM